MDRLKWEREQEWRYTTHSVVKYNPECFKGKSHFTKNQWICMKDVGQVIGGHLVTLDEYLDVEQKYVDSVIKIMELTDCKYLTVSYMEDTIQTTKESILEMLDRKNPFLQYDKLLYNSYMKLYEGRRFDVIGIPDIIRLNLRGYTYTALTNLQKGLEIHFGFDYYMYFNTKFPIDILREEIRKIGLYLDPSREDEI